MKHYRALAPLGAVCAIIVLASLSRSFRRVTYVKSGDTTIVINTPPNSIPDQSLYSIVARPTLEMAFVIDTTGSMGGLIDAAKQKVWCIINSVMQSPSHPRVKVGLVAYRDHGDEYVTKVLPMTDDLDKVYSTLMHYQADGGGDTPEDVRQAMADAVHKVGWSPSAPGLAKLMFLVGDAPPHDDYKNEPGCLKSTEQAVRDGVIVNAIECGSADDTRRVWQEIARRGQGQFLAIAQDGGARAISTPYDDDLATLGSSVGRTYIAYGGSSLDGHALSAGAFRAGKMKAQLEIESDVTAGAPASARADRAVNKAINSEAYDGDFVQDIANGRLKLDSMKKTDLPENMQKLSAPALKLEIDRRVNERNDLKSRILILSKKRDAFIAESMKTQAGRQAGGFDSVIIQAVKQQVGSKGIKL